jgi:hypothetical protein
MAMLIAWQALNKLAASRGVRFSDTFLRIAPGITIRDRCVSFCRTIRRTIIANGTSSRVSP